MTPKTHAIEVSAICGFFILLALGGVAWDISSGLLTSGIDGIMLLFVSAMMAGIFFLIMLAQLIKSGIIPTPKFLQAETKPAAAAKAPTAAAKPAAPGAPTAGAAAKPAAPAAATSGAAPAATPAKPAATPPGTVGTTAPAKPVTPSATPAATPGNGPSAAPVTTPSTPTRTPEK